MPKNSEIINELDSQLLKDIRKLAAANMAPSDIAIKLGINKAGFLRIWRDKNSEIRREWDAGRLDIEATKTKQLKKQIKKGNITAIQIADKKAEEAEFEAMKKEVFSLE